MEKALTFFFFGTEAKPARKMLLKNLNNTLKACRVFNSFELKPILANSNITQRAAQQLNLRVNNLKHPYVRENDVIQQEYTNDLEKSVGKTLLRKKTYSILKEIHVCIPFT